MSNYTHHNKMSSHFGYAIGEKGNEVDVITNNGARFGDIESGNYTEFESDGTIRFKGDATVWNDLPPNPIIRSRTPSSNNPTLATFKGNIDQYRFAVNDYVSDNFEIMHEYKEGTDLVMHIHWANNGEETAEKFVKWELEYTIANAFDEFSEPITISGEFSVPASTPDRTHFVSGIGVIGGEDLKIGAVISYNIKRIASEGNAPAVNPFGLQVAPHIQIDTVGSRQIFTK